MDIESNPAADRPLSAQHAGGLSRSRADRHRGIRAVRAQIAGAARFPDGGRAGAGALPSRSPLRSPRRISRRCAASGAFPTGLLDYLRGLRFTGDVDALPGRHRLLPRRAGPAGRRAAAQAQLVETRLINLLHFETVIASKAARLVLAADGKPLIDFGLRRAHGAEAGMLAARASYIAGFAGTATLAAGIEFGIPVKGTMAHSFIQAHDDEVAAFENFARSRPRDLVLLIDTYDTERAAKRVADLAHRLAAEGIIVSGVRIDSGDLGAEARKVRQILDAAGLPQITIVASGGLDEDQVLALRDAPIDSFGDRHQPDHVDPTRRPSIAPTSCRNMPASHGASARRARPPGRAASRSGGLYQAGGEFAGDIVTLEAERREGGQLLQPVMRGGQRIGPAPSLQADPGPRPRSARAIAGAPQTVGAVRLPRRDFPELAQPRGRARPQGRRGVHCSP